MKRNWIGEIDHCCYPGCQRDRHAAPDAPPFCGDHMVECAVFISREMDFPLLGPPAPPTAAPAAPIVGSTSVVYYVRVADHIKIGTTRNIAQRMKDLYLDHMPNALLATELGGADLESARHREFSEDRVYANRELFHPSPRLLAWIALLKSDS